MYEYNAKVVKVVDGDTIHCDVDLGFNTSTRVVFRFARINAPEVSTLEGVQAREIMKAKLPIGCDVFVHSKGKDKYGRWLGEIERDGVNLNDWMVINGYAKLYS